MGLARLIFAYLALYCFTFFVMFNTREITAGSGYFYLFVAILSFAIVIVLSSDILNLLLIKKSAVFLVIFLLYFVGKYWLESDDFEDTKEMTVGTSGGVIFSISIGFMCSYCLGVIYELRTKGAVKSLSWVLGIFYAIVVVIIGIGTLKLHLAEVRDNIFLVAANEGKYQRVGNLLFIQFMIVSAVLTVIAITSRKITLIDLLAYSIPILILTGLYSLTSQLIGSNSGLATTVLFAVVFLVCMLIFSMSNNQVRRINVSEVLFGGMGIRILIAVSISAALVLLVGIFIVNYYNIDINTLRFTGFGEGENTSIVGRKEIFEQNFIEHFSYSPIFGHTQVDKILDQSYVHSLLSLLPHLGLIGTVFFTFLIFAMYREIVIGSRVRHQSMYTDWRFGLFRILGGCAVLLMALASAYYTWMPLWFAIGFFGDWFHQNRKSSSKRKMGKRRKRSNNRLQAPV